MLVFSLTHNILTNYCPCQVEQHIVCVPLLSFSASSAADTHYTPRIHFSRSSYKDTFYTHAKRRRVITQLFSAGRSRSPLPRVNREHAYRKATATLCLWSHRASCCAHRRRYLSNRMQSICTWQMESACCKFCFLCEDAKSTQVGVQMKCNPPRSDATQTIYIYANAV